MSESSLLRVLLPEGHAKETESRRGLTKRGSPTMSDSHTEASKAPLTQVECEILKLLLLGLNDLEITSRLFSDDVNLSEDLETIYRKLGVAGRLELIIHAYYYGLVIWHFPKKLGVESTSLTVCTSSLRNGRSGDRSTEFAQA
jgi:DNA-binding NarL/FixJ family response regulator